MNAITVKQFTQLGHRTARSIHWTQWGRLGNLQQWLEQHPKAYLVGFLDKEGKVRPFAIWMVDDN